MFREEWYQVVSIYKGCYYWGVSGFRPCVVRLVRTRGFALDGFCLAVGLIFSWLRCHVRGGWLRYWQSAMQSCLCCWCVACPLLSRSLFGLCSAVLLQLFYLHGRTLEELQTNERCKIGLRWGRGRLFGALLAVGGFVSIGWIRRLFFG